MDVQLIVTHKKSNEVTDASFAVEDKVTVGRYLNSPILLQGEGLSRYHFSLSIKKGLLEIEDLSSNGTWLNGKLLKAHLSARVNVGDTIEIPGHRMQVVVATPKSAQAAHVARQPEELSVESKPAWSRPLVAALNFFDSLEIMLMVLAALTFALISFFLTR
ncbi:MAG TPA: FHA domain-containing protein [Bryobacteraceae bacterium]|jgi:predicted component of type VI protein secretion system|nr:FHA domain-containing protein [Bryobacteraceae bacterium]